MDQALLEDAGTCTSTRSQTGSPDRMAVKPFCDCPPPVPQLVDWMPSLNARVREVGLGCPYHSYCAENVESRLEAASKPVVGLMTLKFDLPLFELVPSIETAPP